MNRRKLLPQTIGLVLMLLFMIGCGATATTAVTEAPAATDTPEPPVATNTPAATDTPEPEPTDESDAVLAVALIKEPEELGDIEQLKNGYIRVWLWFPGTIRNIGDVPLTDLRICMNLEYKLAYPYAGECEDLPDLEVGETAEYGVGFHAEAPADAIADAMIKTTVKSGDNPCPFAETVLTLLNLSPMPCRWWVISPAVPECESAMGSAVSRDVLPAPEGVR